MSQQKKQQEAYSNFINSINSDFTRKEYDLKLKYFVEFCNKSSYEDMLFIAENELEIRIRDYIVYLRRDRRLAPATVSSYIAPIIHFYEMNNFTLNWKRLKKFKAKNRSMVEDKPYTKEQIKKLVEAAPMRDKSMILLMASSGMRRGALATIRLKDIDRIDKYNILKFRVYTNEQESYVTYCTPECTQHIEEYMRRRERLGEKFTPNTPLFRVQFDAITQINKPKPVSPNTITFMIHDLLDKTGVRTPSTDHTQRTELMQTHGFRKFFKTICINAGMNPLYSEYLMGHRSGLTKSYFKPTDAELLEGNDKALGYVAAINDLTINEEHRLHKKIDELTKKKDEIELREIKHREELKSMREEMENRFQQILTKIDLTKIK
ncbi:MAG TPA: tyrosine-type recombinase/integrase [Nitrososphaeraceae archaeon]|jgi:integrase